MRRAVALIALAGLAIAIALIAYHGMQQIAQSLVRARWGILAVTAFHLIPVALAATAWRELMGAHCHEPWWVFLRARWIREHVAHLLPVAQVGGEVVGARMLILRGLAPPLAAASVVVDLTVEAVTQVVFTFMGLGVLATLADGRDLLPWLALGALVAALLIGGFFWVQRRGLFAWLEVALKKAGTGAIGNSLGRLDGLHDTIQMLYADTGRLALAGAYHLACWLVGIAETWLALYFMGHRVSWMDALFLESLGEAIRGAAFFIPGQLGVQEGGYMLLGQAIGLAPGTGLALSLIKRARVLLLGVPALATWQLVESRSLLARRRES